MIVELRSVVSELRQKIESQRARIERLVRITFGRGVERIEGPTLFDAIASPESATPRVVEPPPV